MLKCVTYDNKGMHLTGGKILQLIAAKEIPGIDLYVRETVQNSTDAILENVDHGRIEYNIGNFDKDILANQFEEIAKNLKVFYPNSSYQFISISDKNTTGLLGGYLKEDTGPKNLYNLVYDIMVGKSDSSLGGGHGIGKTISSFFGNGITIYYTRTYENGKYINKLAATLVEDEKKPNALLAIEKDGLAYFGSKDIKHNCAMPIYDDNEIEKILTIFGLNLYSGDETGTTCIIPFLNKNGLLNYYNCQEKPYWFDNLEESLILSIQRWYFPRINNEKYNGKWFEVKVNGTKIKLNSFFDNLQQLYNGDLEDSDSFPIISDKIDKKECLGYLRFKRFSEEELGINVPPINLPSPYDLLDINKGESTEHIPIYMYTRKPGMIINYKNDLCNVGEETLDYSIGIFVLNDSLNYCEENLSVYFKESENANHFEWKDINAKNCPNLTVAKPFDRIKSLIRKKMKSLFEKKSDLPSDKSIDKLRKDLANKLLPPDGSYPKPSTPPVPPGPVNPSKLKKVSCKFVGFDKESNCLKYNYIIKLAKNEMLNSYLNVVAGSSKYDLNEWCDLGFEVPIETFSIIFSYVQIKETIDDNYKNRQIDNSLSQNDLSNVFVKKIGDKEVFNYKGISINDKCLKSFNITNPYFNSLVVSFDFLIRPKNIKYSIAINNMVSGGDV